MTNEVDLGKLISTAQNLLDKLNGKDEFLLSDVYNITRQAYEKYREDPVIKRFAAAIENLVEKHGGGALISKSDMTYLYDNFNTINQDNVFRKVLGHFINDAPIQNINKNEDFIKANRVDWGQELPTAEPKDPELNAYLQSMFGEKVAFEKAYNKDLAKKGQDMVDIELQSLGFDGHKLSVVAGDNDTIIYNAKFLTHKGDVNIAIPLDVSRNKVAFPSVFATNSKFEELTGPNLYSHITKKLEAGDLSTPEPALVLKAVNVALGKIALAAPEEQPNELDGVWTSTIPGEQEIANAKLPKGLESLARDFEDRVLEAASEFGLEAVNIGKVAVKNVLNDAGFIHAQVKFAAESGDSAIYLASIKTPKGFVELEVPVEMAVNASGKYMPTEPTYFAYDGLVESFTSENIRKFALRLPPKSSGETLCLTGYAYLNLPELKQELVTAAKKDDYISCEAILDTIEDKYLDDYSQAVNEYSQILIEKNNIKTASYGKRCNLEIPAGKYSTEPMCGHLNVPISKTAIDENGRCRLKTALEAEKVDSVTDSIFRTTSHTIHWS